MKMIFGSVGAGGSLTPLELQTYYILSLFYYPEDNRVDVTNNVGAGQSLFLPAGLA